jgi:hypothetical protein
MASSLVAGLQPSRHRAHATCTAHDGPRHARRTVCSALHHCTTAPLHHCTAPPPHRRCRATVRQQQHHTETAGSLVASRPPRGAWPSGSSSNHAAARAFLRARAWRPAATLLPCRPAPSSPSSPSSRSPRPCRIGCVMGAPAIVPRATVPNRERARRPTQAALFRSLCSAPWRAAGLKISVVKGARRWRCASLVGPSWTNPPRAGSASLSPT